MMQSSTKSLMTNGIEVSRNIHLQNMRSLSTEGLLHLHQGRLHGSVAKAPSISMVTPSLNPRPKVELKAPGTCPPHSSEKSDGPLPRLPKQP